MLVSLKPGFWLRQSLIYGHALTIDLLNKRLRQGGGVERGMATVAADSDDAIGRANGDAREAQHLATVFGERNVSAIAFEQPHAEVFLELAQLNAQCGLGDRAALGSAREIQTIG